jgi:hypothetical protein
MSMGSHPALYGSNFGGRTGDCTEVVAIGLSRNKRN